LKDFTGLSGDLWVSPPRVLVVFFFGIGFLGYGCGFVLCLPLLFTILGSLFPTLLPTIFQTPPLKIRFPLKPLFRPHPLVTPSIPLACAQVSPLALCFFSALNHLAVAQNFMAAPEVSLLFFFSFSLSVLFFFPHQHDFFFFSPPPVDSHSYSFEMWNSTGLQSHPFLLPKFFPFVVYIGSISTPPLSLLDLF